MKYSIVKRISSLLILSNIALPLGSVWSSSDVEYQSDSAIAQRATQAADIFSSSTATDAAAQLGAAMVSDNATSQVSSWLKDQGKVSVNINTDNTGSLKNSEAKVLYPIYDSEQLMTFTQAGFHHSDDRHQGNFGLGTRYFQTQWMGGINAFYDRDFTLGHSRMGGGVEYTRDFMRISANSYARLSKWHNDKRMTDYQSRPANGWDVRSEAWLPAYPQLGGKLNFEQYYGHEVALVSYNDRQPNPYAVTAGVNFTPVPLITAGVDVKRGKSGASETQLGLSFNYTHGESWSYHTSPDAVAIQRSLLGTRYEFVNRNNNIVLDYRKNDAFTLGFPAEIRGTELTEVTFTPLIKAQHNVSYLEIDTAELTRTGGSLVSSSPSAVVIRLPTNQPQGIRLTGVAVDNRGNRSNIAESMIYTTEGAHELIIDADKNEAIADGYDSVILTIHVNSASGVALEGSEITLKTDAGILSSTAGKTDASGNYIVTLSSEESGEIHVTAMEGNQLVAHPGIKFITATKGSLSLDKAEAMADGKDAVEVTLLLTDSTSKPLSDREVSWKTSMGTLSTTSNKTGPDGSVSVLLLSTNAGNAFVTATVGNDRWTSENISFAQGDGKYAISVDKMQAIANGSDKITFTVTAFNFDGTVMEGEKVSWSSDVGSLSDAITTIDANGKSSVYLSSTANGNAHVSVNIAGEVISATEVKFKKEALILDLSVNQTFFYATGSSGPLYTLTARNPDGSPAAGEVVVWATDHGSLDIKSSITDVNGKAQAYVYSKTPGLSHTSASIEELQVNADEVTFLEFLEIELSGETTEAKADGKPVTFTLSVKDIDKYPVSGRDVKWETTIGQLSDTILKTDSKGRSEVKLSSVVAGTGNITADVNGSPVSMPITFLEDVSVSVTSDKTQITSSGYDWVTYTATVRNTDGSLAAGETVHWATSTGTLAQNSTVTDSYGQTTVRLTSSEVGVAKVTATAKNITQEAPIVTVVQYIVTFITHAPDGIADGKTPVTLIFTAENTDRTPLPGVEVTWTSNGGTLSSSKTITGEDGTTFITITSSVEGTIRVIGDLVGNRQTAAIHFNPVSVDSDLILNSGKALTDAASPPTWSKEW